MKKKTVIAVVLLIGLVLLAVYVSPKVDAYFDVDTCLDGGGRVLDGHRCEYADGRIEKM